MRLASLTLLEIARHKACTRGMATFLAGFTSRARKYPIVTITLAIFVICLVLALTGADTAAQWIASGFALVIAAIEAKGMIAGLMKGRWGIDILAVMAIVATVAVGEFWASLVIVLMLSGGEALEDFAAGKATRELNALLSRAPQIAHRLDAEGAASDIPVTEVRVGDTLLVRPSEVVPVDAELVSDSGEFDESSLTGESLPVERHRGDGVLSGSVNGERAVTITATAASADSQYQRIVALVSDAAESRAPMVRLADRYAVPFTAVSLAIAGIAWAVSGDPVRFAEVLVVATPCPLLIAAPVAFMGGMSRAARHGIIVKNGGTLEQLSRIKTAAFDKTGTLTHGEPAVEEIRPRGMSDDELLSLVASAEQYSSHVLAHSLVALAETRGLPLHASDDATEQATNGVSATIAGRRVVVGKFRFVAEHAPDAAPTPIVGGQLAVYIAVDGAFAGAIVLSDQLRSNAGDTLRALRASGIQHMVMLTGDAEETARHIAAEVGLPEVQSALLPEDKVRAVREAPHRPVMMVGDGVNDAPVLAVADVGVSMGARGSTAASESADVVITVDDLSRVATAVEVGRHTTAVAVQSIWLGIALSVGLMIVGAFGFLPAIVGAALQEAVDLATILNALRALRGPRKLRGADQLRGSHQLASVRPHPAEVPRAVEQENVGRVSTLD